MYDDHGHLIGESVSESTEPILAAHPISLLFIRCLLSQVCSLLVVHSIHPSDLRTSAGLLRNQAVHSGQESLPFALDLFRTNAG